MHMAEREIEGEESKDVMSKAGNAIAELEAEFRAGASMEMEYFYIVARKA
jgi:hypothetical protein